jgi:Uri superfamily endonuclease
MIWPDDVRSLLPLAELVGGEAGLPAATGAYALLIHLERPVRLRWKGGFHQFEGRYLYAGNAGGSGGLRARVSRHLRRDKVLHWHVDALTAVADQIEVLVIPGGEECTIVETLLASGSCEQALHGFGSSDCRRCASHLLLWQGR